MQSSAPTVPGGCSWLTSETTLGCKGDRGPFATSGPGCVGPNQHLESCLESYWEPVLALEDWRS